MPKYIKGVEIYNAEVLRGRYRNFSGADKGFGPLDPGKGSFNVRLTPETTLRISDEEAGNIEFVGNDVAEYLINEGWNLRIHQPRDEEDEPFYYMTVKFAYRNREGMPVAHPPMICRVSEKTNVITKLSESSVSILDDENIVSCDVKLSANTNFASYDKTGKASAYLRDGYFICREDYFSSRYRNSEVNEPEEPLPFT